MAQLLEDVRDESSKYGVVEAVAVPAPPATVPEAEPGRVYVMFATAEQCSKAHAGVAGCFSAQTRLWQPPCASAPFYSCACMLRLLFVHDLDVCRCCLV